MLAKADPVGAVHLAVSQLLAECNDPNELLNGALEDVWQEWYEQTDPIISGALRLTLDTPLYPIDVKQFELLAKDLNADKSSIRRLMIWLLARVDERHVTYDFTNSAELVAKDNELVAQLNKIAEDTNLPSIAAINNAPISETSGSKASSKSELPIVSDDTFLPVAFPAGSPGLASAIRTWVKATIRYSITGLDS